MVPQRNEEMKSIEALLTCIYRQNIAQTVAASSYGARRSSASRESVRTSLLVLQYVRAVCETYLGGSYRSCRFGSLLQAHVLSRVVTWKPYFFNLFYLIQRI